MTPDLSFTTSSREGESSARITDGIWGKKTDTIREQLFRQATLTRNYSSSTRWGYSYSISPCDKPK